MPNIPSLTPKKILRILQEFGFNVDHITGSHYILYNSQTNKRVTVPFHCKDLPKGTFYSILRAAGISSEELKEFL